MKVIGEHTEDGSLMGGCAEVEEQESGETSCRWKGGRVLISEKMRVGGRKEEEGVEGVVIDWTKEGREFQDSWGVYCPQDILVSWTAS